MFAESINKIQVVTYKLWFCMKEHACRRTHSVNQCPREYWTYCLVAVLSTRLFIIELNDKWRTRLLLHSTTITSNPLHCFLWHYSRALFSFTNLVWGDAQTDAAGTLRNLTGSSLHPATPFATMDVRKHGCDRISEAKCMWWQLQKQKTNIETHPIKISISMQHS